MKKPILLLIALISMLLSCVDDTREITVSGDIFDPYTSQNVVGAKVVLSATLVQSGIYHSNFSQIAKATTDASGSYLMKFNVEKSSGYKISITQDNYFDYEEEITTDDMESDDIYPGNYELNPRATIILNVKNVTPKAMDDQIDFKYTNIIQTCKTCCNNELNTGIGPAYDTTLQCEVVGARYLKIYWTITKKGIQTYHSDSVFTPAFQTTTYNINY